MRMNNKMIKVHFTLNFNVCSLDQNSLASKKMVMILEHFAHQNLQLLQVCTYFFRVDS